MTIIKTSILSLLMISLFCTASEETLYKGNPKIPFTSPTPWLNTREDLLRHLPQNAVVAEIGVWEGAFSTAILNLAKPNKLFLIDAWEEQPVSVYEEQPTQQLYDYLLAQVTKKFANDPRVTILKQYSNKAASQFPDNYFDWIYIDGNHAYEAVKDDLAVWLPKIKTGGFITGHDYFAYTPDKPSISQTFGVVQAVNEFIYEHKFELVYLTNESIPSYAIAIK